VPLALRVANAECLTVTDRHGVPKSVGISSMRATTSISRDTVAADEEAGFTLVELMVAMAVFAILMVIVGGAMLSGFVGVQDIMARTETGASARIAGDWTGKLLRYTDLPEGQAAAITEASSTSITFFTYSGTGAKRDVPYRARLYTVTNADATRSIMSQVWTPLSVTGGWTWATPPVTRNLLTLPPTASTPLRVAVWVRNPLVVPAAEPRLATPVTSGPLVLNSGEVPESVVLQIGDQNDPRNLVTQQIRLGNLT
jgi:prepilin-type N-terminal cleavage/methylation domain-containing protein